MRLHCKLHDNLHVRLNGVQINVVVVVVVVVYSQNAA